MSLQRAKHDTTRHETQPHLVGSSKKMTAGADIISTAIDRRFRSPPEIPRTVLLPTMESATLVKPNCSNNSCTISSRACSVNRDPTLSSTRNFSVSRTVMCGKKLTSCSIKADGTILSPSNSFPLMYRRPYNFSLGLSLILPAKAWSRVDLPAPLCFFFLKQANETRAREVLAKKHQLLLLLLLFLLLF